jgi:VIT1/CCC1 family predicted Fe2+/Mn2+ transporter
MRHLERHKTDRIGWLRAAVLGANDGTVSTASLVLGVAAAGASSNSILIAGIAGLVAGAMSMAAGEYVSVSSQADTERADPNRERHELATQPQSEHNELAAIYVRRGLGAEPASEVATQLMAHDALGAHARDELGVSESMTARPGKRHWPRLLPLQSAPPCLSWLFSWRRRLQPCGLLRPAHSCFLRY